MDNLHFKSEDIFYLFDTEDCLNIDISQKVIINKASVGRNLTIDKEKLNAQCFKLSKKEDAKCLIIKINNNLEGKVTIRNNQKYNCANIKGRKFN